MKKAFTLIELLVVVLIIGILAAIALPMYQKAVVKSRFSEARITLKAVKDAADRCLLEHGDAGMLDGTSPCYNLDGLDITPAGTLEGYAGDTTSMLSTTKYFRYGRNVCTDKPESAANTFAAEYVPFGFTVCIMSDGKMVGNNIACYGDNGQSHDLFKTLGVEQNNNCCLC